METDSGTEKKKKAHLTDFNSGWCFSFNVQAGQVGHVENSVGQGADSAGQAGHVEHSTVALNKDRLVNTISRYRYSLNDQKDY